MLSRQSMLEFYATSGDFTRRLTSIKANSKFSSPLAGPEEYYSVRCRGQAKLVFPLAYQSNFGGLNACCFVSKIAELLNVLGHVQWRSGALGKNVLSASLPCCGDAFSNASSFPHQTKFKFQKSGRSASECLDQA